MKYIFYCPHTLKILATFKYWNKNCQRLSEAGWSWVNITHPKNKEKVNKINEVNKTTF